MNIIRLCANTGAQLHLINPLGFVLDDKKLRRAGLDYHEWVAVKVHESLNSFIETIQPERIFALTTKGTQLFSDTAFKPQDAVRPRNTGLACHNSGRIGCSQCLYLPMQSETRSLNLSNTVSIVLYEAWRQLAFAGALIK